MYALICLKDGDIKIPIPIMASDDDGKMAVWNDYNELKAFVTWNPLCQISENLIIDLDTMEIDYL